MFSSAKLRPFWLRETNNMLNKLLDFWEESREFWIILGALAIAVLLIIAMSYGLLKCVSHTYTPEENAARVSECAKVCGQAGCSSEFNLKQNSCSCRCNVSVERVGRNGGL